MSKSQQQKKQAQKERKSRVEAETPWDEAKDSITSSCVFDEGQTQAFHDMIDKLREAIADE